MSEFSRKVPLSRIDKDGLTRHIEAKPEERALLAERFDLLSLDRLEADVTLHRVGSKDIAFSAEMIADATQSCVVTLDPVPAEIRERFRLIFRHGVDEAAADLLALEDPEGDVVEPLPADAIDIGEAVAQQLSLVLDPFPRSPGADSALSDLDAKEATTGD